MCKLCDAVEQASRIDNINADTSLKLANAAAALISNARNKEGDELIQAALNYWREPKKAAAASITEEVAARAEDNTRQADSSGEAGTALPFVVDNTTGQVFVKGREVGTLQLSESLFGTALFFKRAPQ